MDVCVCVCTTGTYCKSVFKRLDADSRYSIISLINVKLIKKKPYSIIMEKDFH